jgi:hypothetical protein
LRIKEQETRLTLHEHDDDDDDNVAIFQFEIHKQGSYFLLKWPEIVSVKIATEPVGRAI